MKKITAVQFGRVPHQGLSPKPRELAPWDSNTETDPTLKNEK
jgi:hypothetical protein